MMAIHCYIELGAPICNQVIGGSVSDDWTLSMNEIDSYTNLWNSVHRVYVCVRGCVRGCERACVCVCFF